MKRTDEEKALIMEAKIRGAPILLTLAPRERDELERFSYYEADTLYRRLRDLAFISEKHDAETDAMEPIARRHRMLDLSVEGLRRYDAYYCFRRNSV